MNIRRRINRLPLGLSHFPAEAVLSIGVFAGALAFFVAATDPLWTPPITTSDQVFFLLVGDAWVGEGVIPYLHVWDVKPPLIHEVSALTALVTSTLRQQYIVLVVVTGVLAASVPALTAALIYRETSSQLASLTAAAIPLTLPAFWLYAAGGLRPKYGAAAFGLASIYALRREWDGTAAALGVLAAGWWQIALIFPAIVVVRIVEARRASLRRVLAGGVAVTAVVIAPIVLEGGLVPMLNQVVLAPVAVPESQHFTRDIAYAFSVLPFAALLILFGLYAGPRALLDRRDCWPLVVPAVWFVVALILFDLDGTPDTFLLVSVAGMAIGAYLGRCSVPRRAVVALAVCFVVVPVGAGFVVSDDPRESMTGVREWDIEEAYPALGEQCHVRLSALEEGWISKVDGSPDTHVCSRLLEYP